MPRSFAHSRVPVGALVAVLLLAPCAGAVSPDETVITGERTGPIAEIETAIGRLDGSNYTDLLGPLLQELGQVEDPPEQERLRGLLQERMDTLVPSEPPPPDPAAIHEELGARIGRLQLGPDATADDLRARDALVAEIAGLRDPIQREQLLQQLDSRERQSAQQDLVEPDPAHTASPEESSAEVIDDYPPSD